MAADAERDFVEPDTLDEDEGTREAEGTGETVATEAAPRVAVDEGLAAVSWAGLRAADVLVVAGDGDADADDGRGAGVTFAVIGRFVNLRREGVDGAEGAGVVCVGEAFKI